MINVHCGVRIIILPHDKNQHYFRARCSVCNRTFKQRKRQPMQKCSRCGYSNPITHTYMTGKPLCQSCANNELKIGINLIKVQQKEGDQK